MSGRVKEDFRNRRRSEIDDVRNRCSDIRNTKRESNVRDENRYKRTLSSIEHIEWVLGVPIGHSMISFSIYQFLLFQNISTARALQRDF